jgi:diguanylate cyclase (GGDEF)-like protein
VQSSRFGARVRLAAAAAMLIGVSMTGRAAACVATSERERLVDAAGAALASGAQMDLAWRHVVDAARACNDAEGEARALADWSMAARKRGATERVQLNEAARVSLAAAHGLLAHEAEARLHLGEIAIARGDIQHAVTQLDASRDRYARLGDIAGEARVFTELSRLERRRGDYLAALRYELSGLERRRRVDPPLEIWRSLLNLAVLYEQIELFDQARENYAAALAEAERGGVPEQIGDALNGYAGFLNDFGRDAAPEALAMATRALSIHRGLGDTARTGSCLLQVGRAQLALGQFDAARDAFASALQVADTGGFEALRAHVEFRWGELEFARGDAGAALERIETARAEYERQGNRHRLIKVHAVLERIYTALGDAMSALSAGREHFRLRNELLGANATGRLGEVLTNFALTEEQLRNERLQRENALSAIRLESERRLRHAGYVIAAIVIAGLLLLAWRHASVRRLNQLLRAQTSETEAQRAALSEANARLTHLNRIDSLTGLATRAHGLERLSDALDHARERATSPALLLMDLDHFKEINDRFGHPAGDQVLMAVAAVMLELLPADALAARVGGEEFMVLLEHADHARADMLADAIRRRVRDLAVDVGPQRVAITMSTGIAHVDSVAVPSVRALYAAADQALYAAKHAGRDCVRTHGTPH